MATLDTPAACSGDTNPGFEEAEEAGWARSSGLPTPCSLLKLWNFFFFFFLYVVGLFL